MKKQFQICFVTCALLLQVCAAKSKYNEDGEDNPYEFGFTIDGQQHRHEKKDANGIIQGEFGFITADGIYHVTVYATDENGNFKILSMRNVRVSGPLDEPNAKLPDTSQFSKEQKPVAPIAPNPLSISSTAKPVTVTQRQNAQFTTQPTIKPACAGCGYVTTPKAPTGGAQNNKLPFQTPAGERVSGKQPVPEAPFVSNKNPVRPGNNDVGFPNNQPGAGSPQNQPGAGFPQNQPGAGFPQAGSPQNQPGAGFPQNQPGGGFQQNQPGAGFPQNQPGVGSPQNQPGAGFPQNQPGAGFQQNQPQQGFGNNQPGSPVQNDPIEAPVKPNPLSVSPPPNGITVSNGMINIPNNPPIEIKDKFPNMADGLPPGINEGDITDLLYKFNYTVGFHGHYEKGYKNGAKVGGYFVNDRDGVSRIVTYVADENGYRPKVKFIRLDLNSDLVPKEGTEKTFGLKNFEFVWYPIN